MPFRCIRWSLTTNGIFSVKSYYLDLINGHAAFKRGYLWKLKIPLKIKIFLSFLSIKELLTKDNLAKPRWTGGKKCVFCDTDESVERNFARDIWRLVHFTFNINPPTSVSNMFGGWLNGIEKVIKTHVRIGIAAILWAYLELP